MQHRFRQSLVFSFALAVLVLAAGCVSRPPAPPPSRDTPAGTVEMFKKYAREGNYAGEWDILSPGLKQRINQMAGRNVDVGDYMQARRQARTDPQMAQAEQALQTAFVSGQRQTGPNTMTVIVTATRGPFSKSAPVRMIKQDRWELSVVGSDEPYWGFVDDPTFGVEKQPDGSFIVWSRASAGAQRTEQRIPASDVRAYGVTSRWYLDDLGGLEQQFLGTP